MMRNRRRLLLAAGGSFALGGCGYSLEHGLFNACRAELPPKLARDEAVLAAWDGLATLFKMTPTSRKSGSKR